MAILDELLYPTTIQQLREPRLLPSKKAKIGAFYYKVIETAFKNQFTHGETSVDNKEIIIYSWRNSQIVKDTCVHEFLHALLDGICISLFPDLDEDAVDKKEEALIQLLAPRLLQFIQDNPKWIKYLQQKKNC
jgi:hypothetical protein